MTCSPTPGTPACAPSHWWVACGEREGREREREGGGERRGGGGPGGGEVNQSIYRRSGHKTATLVSHSRRRVYHSNCIAWERQRVLPWGALLGSWHLKFILDFLFPALLAAAFFPPRDLCQQGEGLPAAHRLGKLRRREVWRQQRQNYSAQRKTTLPRNASHPSASVVALWYLTHPSSARFPQPHQHTSERLEPGTVPYQREES